MWADLRIQWWCAVRDWRRRRAMRAMKGAMAADRRARALMQPLSRAARLEEV